MSKGSNLSKHGGYAKQTFLWDESPEEYEKLKQETYQEWAPEGPTEEHCVLTIVEGLWRRMRYSKARQIALELARASAEAINAARTKLTSDGALVRKITDAKTYPELEEALRGLGLSNLEDFLRSGPTLEAAKAQLVNVLTQPTAPCENLILALITPESIERDIATEARIDATMERAIKRLGSIKLMKRMPEIRPGSPEVINPKKQISN
jgi:hypothetical protein